MEANGKKLALSGRAAILDSPNDTLQNIGSGVCRAAGMWNGNPARHQIDLRFTPESCRGAR
jgi:hypothetical protein